MLDLETDLNLIILSIVKFSWKNTIYHQKINPYPASHFVNIISLFHCNMGNNVANLRNIAQRGWEQASLFTASVTICLSAVDRISQVIIFAPLKNSVFSMDGHCIKLSMNLTIILL